MKILQIITLADNIGGAQIHLIDLANELHKRNHTVVVYTGNHGKLNEKLNSLNIANESLLHLKREINLFEDIRSYKELKKIIISHDPDVVACHSSKAGILVRLVCYTLKIPCTFTVHGWSCASGTPFIQKLFYLNLERILGIFSNKLITVSKADEQFGLKHRIVKIDKIVNIYNGVRDLSSFQFSNLKEVKPFTMVMSARFQDQKDHITLIKALIPLKDLDWILYLLGDGDKTVNKVKNLVNDSGLVNKVKFIGFVDGIEEYLCQADLFLLISKWEGFPLSILEAMSMSLPILASDVGGVREQVLDNFNGYLIKRYDNETLSEKIKFLYNNRNITKEMGKKSRELYLEKFTLMEMVNQTENLYKSLINA